MTPFEWTLAALGFAAIEYWLGKTDKVKAGSLVEALALAARAILRRP